MISELSGTDGTSARPLRVALVGCGAVAENLHLPALQSLDSARITALVDPDPRRREVLANHVGEVHGAGSTDGLEDFADVAIVGVPHHLHATIGADLLNRGLHVFIEKPLASTAVEARDLVDLAARLDRRLAVGQIRRFYETFAFARAVLEAGWLGPIQRFDFEEGGVYGWPAASDALFRREKGGGVLLDTGAHLLDMLTGWLGDDVHVEECQDDSRGGVDANCKITLRLGNGTTGRVELSRTRNLRNTCRIEGELGELEVGIGPHGPVSLRANGIVLSGLPRRGSGVAGDFRAFARAQLADFVRAVKDHGRPTVPGEAALPSIRIFDQCRKQVQPWTLPWERFEADVDWSELAGRRVLVLGATGFVGGRLVEALMGRGDVNVRILARDYSRLSGVSRYPVEFFHGDAADPACLEQTLEGCDYVINCTYGKGDRREQRRVNVDAVRSLIRAAAAKGVTKVVHTSTVSVYGVPAEGEIHEGMTARAPRRDAYGHTKRLGEKVALQEGERLGLAVTVLQPTVIYGPGAPIWSAIPLQQMRSGRIALVAGGRGICNAVYVDDVVAALLKAVTSDGSAGERLLVSGPKPVTWGDFYGAYDAMLGGGGIELIGDDELARLRTQQKRARSTVAQLKGVLRHEYSAAGSLIELPPIAAFRNVVRAAVPRRTIERMKGAVLQQNGGAAETPAAPDRPLLLPQADQEALHRSQASVRREKATRLIGFEPAYTLEAGMARVAAWAEWARLT
jgi:predicted dehydrogenase/nucleoside-diphosphate-sugar epimerase